MYNMKEWLAQAIEATGGFILWVILMMVAAALVIFAVVAVYALIKAAVDGIKGGKKKDE